MTLWTSVVPAVERLPEHDAMAFRCLDAELAKAPGFVGNSLIEHHAALAVPIVQFVDTLAIYVREQRMIAGLPGRPFALSVAHHQVKAMQVQEGPAADGSFERKSELVGKIGHRAGKVVDRQNVLSLLYFEHVFMLPFANERSQLSAQALLHLPPLPDRPEEISARCMVLTLSPDTCARRSWDQPFYNRNFLTSIRQLHYALSRRY